MPASPDDDALFSVLEETPALDQRPDLIAFLGRVCARYGFQHLAYLATYLPDRQQHEPYIAVTYPATWIDRYREAGYLRIDPVLVHGFQTILPVDWDTYKKRARPVRQLFGEAAEFGIGPRGLTVPIRGRMGERALLSVSSREPLRDWQTRLGWLRRDMQVLAYHLHQAVLRVEGIKTNPATLGPREAQCLLWVARGKTFAETATILGLSERTVRFYLDLARSKLGTTNITQTVAKAISLDLIPGQ